MKKILHLLTCLLLSSAGFTQNTTCDWAFAPVGTNTYNSKVYNTTIDHQGNIIECGTIAGVADMDPGSGPADTAFSKPSFNYYLRKTTMSGQLLWVRFFNQTTPIPTFTVHGLEVNSQDEIIIAGNYFGTLDMDLSTTGVDTINSHQPTYTDFFLAKYDANANLQWAHTYGGTSSNIGVASIAMQANDNILVSFSGGSNMDMDPGAGTALAVGGSANIACYDTDGNYVWKNQISKPTSYAVNCKSISRDAAGNSYLLSVGYYELTVTKFDVNGIQLWGKTIGDFQNLARVEPHSLLVDTNGDFFIVGKYLGTVDFDPNSGSLNHTSSSVNDHDGFFIAYDPNMNPYWVKTYEGIITFGNQSLARSGSELVTGGRIAGTVTIAPGINFTSPSNSPFLIKTDNQGNFLAGTAFPCFGWTTTVNVSSQGKLVTTGVFSGSVDIDPTTSGTVTITSNANSGSYTAVYASPLSAINNPSVFASIAIYPNPARNYIQLTHPFTEITSATIYNTNGQTVKNISLKPGETILSTETLPSGVYTLQLQTENSIATSRFVIGE